MSTNKILTGVASVVAAGWSLAHAPVSYGRSRAGGRSVR